MNSTQLKKLLNTKVAFYNNRDFIAADPISIPHSFTKKQDIEIAGFFAAIFAWGQRTTIINKTKEFMLLMDNAPHDFCKNHQQKDFKKLLQFKHRTFNADDTIYFMHFLQQHYKVYPSLETAFFPNKKMTVEQGLIHFRNYFFSFEHLPRTHKHISSPLQKSACKRLNMYLRWMVRNDAAGVDFGLWKNIESKELICPLDVHVSNIARQLSLLQSPKNDWAAAMELTNNLKQFDANDPVKYDFALFSMGVMEKLPKSLKYDF
jgi:uncharacterized protein (TIGR02757 family)